MLTSSQRKALDLRRNLSVTANAGSGKTHVLVERFVRILLEPGVEPESVVAITFTERAAAELRTKITEAFENKINASPDDLHLRSLRAKLGDAFVGTIHSFCRMLLRNYPLEANVDADFMVFDSTEALYLQREAITEALRETLDAATTGDDPRRLLFLRYGRKAVEDIVNLLFLKRELASHITQLYARSDDDILAQWSAVIESTLQLIINDVPLMEIEELSKLHTTKQSGKVVAALKRYEAASTLRLQGAAVRELLDVILTEKGTVHAHLIPKQFDKSDWIPFAKKLSALQQRESIFRFDVDEAQRAEEFRTLLADTRLLLDIAALAQKKYREKKEDRGGLDFDDLQLHATRVLEDENVRTEIQETYSYFLVDEFQDTNRLQYLLLELLTNHIAKGNVFIVGDPKQSIYGFRNADVAVFAEARNAIGNANPQAHPFVIEGDPLEATPDERRGALLLAESFRMLPGIAAFVNFLFGALMRNDGVGYDVIIPQRHAPAMPAAHIEWMLPHEKEDEPEWIAKRIVELLSSNTEQIIVEEKNNATRAPEPRDIAILLRKRNQLPALEQSLFQCGVPYAVAGGIGFYGRQEILDLSNYLKFLVTPSDDIACVAVLRSPYFLINDAVLFTVAQTKASGDGSFCSRVVAHAAQPAADAALRDAVQLLQRHHGAAFRVTVTELIAMIQAETLWAGTIAAHPQADQVRANVNKLIAMAREVQSRGFTALYDFVEILERLADEGEKEGQAEIASSGNVVHVMTVHNAKGLEFPIVMLPFLKANPSRSNFEFLDREIGIMFSKKGSGVEKSELYNLVKARAQRQSEEEDRRVFYVACTRARDALILSSFGELAGKSWAAQMGAALGVDAPADGWLELPDVKIRIRTNIIDANFYKPISKNILSADEQEHIREENIFIDTIPSEPYGEFFSASHFVTWSQCPTKYVLRYMLGAQEEFRPRADAELNGDDRIYGSVRGTATHAVLARLDRFGDREIIDIAREEVEQTGYQQPDKEELVHSVAALVRNTQANKKWKSILSLQPAYTELELAAAVGKEFVHGVIDRLACDASGTWHIIDYKTDNISAANAQLKRDTYALQLQVYAFLVLTHYHDAPNVTTHLWFLRAPDQSHSETFDRSMLPRLRQKMETLLAEITATQALGSESPRTRSHCPHCGFARSAFGEYRCSLE